MTIEEDEEILGFEVSKTRKANIFIKTPRVDRDLGRWIIDSEGSRHMTSSSFRTHQQVLSSQMGQRHHRSKRGDISIDLGGKRVQMKNVLWVPQLDSNLLSIKALNRKGLSALFHPEGVKFFRDGTIVVTDFYKSNMFLLRNSKVALKTKEPGDHEEISEEFRKKELSGDQASGLRAELSKPKTEQAKIGAYLLWHARLGHVSARRIQLLFKKVALRSLDYSVGAGLIILGVDSSGKGWGAILMQEREGKRHPSRYESGIWSNTEKSYDAAKRECRGVLKALKKVRNYLYGVRFLLETDASVLVAQLNRGGD